MVNLLFATKPVTLDVLRLSFRPDTEPDAASAKALGEVAAYYFESGLSDYSAWAQRMTSELGRAVQPYLRKAWISIPQRMSSRADELNSSPLTTQVQRVAVSLRCADLIAVWQDSYKRMVLSEEFNVCGHSHFCPVCSREWTCKDRDCMLPNEYWCESHAGTQPLPERLRTDTHGHYCSGCRSYWGHRYRECLLPEVYECDDHGGISDEEFLRADLARNRKQSVWEKASWLWKYVPVIGCILALLTATFSRWPYAFYVLLRLGVCAVSVYWAVEMFKQQQTLWAWALGANAVLFNPVFPIHMARSDWEILNLLDALFLAAWTTVLYYREKRRPHGTHSGSGKSGS